MKIRNFIWKWIPEIYFILISIWWAWDSYTHWDGVINYPAVILICILILQFFIKNRPIGLIISSLLGLVSTFLILAMWSDLDKFPEFNFQALRFLVTAGLFIATNISMSVLMFRKYNRYSEVNELSEV